ncbi:ankyrin repeat domain-containing protein [Stieleria sp. TO1_6]|uniref:ankyrin repeat domain-containing protein n=1 Tax=Stieleria tagensis TaxID=2956795 RepID=UPI00209A8334|nr:ankyrin repeat domain-containing protein [Stieleria tagensis]MCO8122956.1 ankyrin repeat domain-containing protein [Stieleria tagensis]
MPILSIHQHTLCCSLVALIALSQSLGCEKPADQATAVQSTEPAATGTPAVDSTEQDASSADSQAGKTADASTPAAKTESAAKTETAATSDGSKPSDPLYSPEAFRDAALNGKQRVVQVCLDDNIDVNDADVNGFTALAMAAYNGHDEIVKLLLKKNATVDVRDAEGKTPLIHASSGPYPTTVQLLLDAGADINAVDSGEHFTPLMMAAALGNIEVVKVLLASGAKRDLVDADGESAADFAQTEGNDKILELLRAE